MAHYGVPPVVIFGVLFHWELFHSVLLDDVFVRPKWQIVDALEMQRFEAEWDQLVTLLYAEAEKSALPATYDGYVELNALLLDIRQHGDRVQGNGGVE